MKLKNKSYNSLCLSKFEATLIKKVMKVDHNVCVDYQNFNQTNFNRKYLEQHVNLFSEAGLSLLVKYLF